MPNIKVTFPDGAIKEVESGISSTDVIKNHIGERLLQAAIAVKVNSKTQDLTTPLTTDSTFQVLTYKDEEGIEIFKHSSSHILALAIKKLFPEAKLAIGPAIEEGFYYDIEINKPFTEEDLARIEEEMYRIIKADLPFRRIEVTPSEAKRYLVGEPYKLEMIDELKATGEKISIYYLGNEWCDLCLGPHVASSGKIKAIKLLKTSGAYWKGDSKNKQLNRIYGISFPEKKTLDEYLKMLEESQKRDHRKIGREMDLFSFHDEAPGMPFFHDKGTFIWNTLVEYVTEVMKARNYEINKTPIILNKSLWLQSGHWDHYKDNMYFTKIDEQKYAIKPMNCPGNILVYKAHQYSYRDLPIRAGEFGLVHRHELSGALSGLFRVRCFTQDDAHVFCTPEQIKSEVADLISFVDEVYKTFGFEYTMELSTKPDKAMGDPKLWELAENELKEVLKKTGKDYKLNPGDGAFYGPKIDFHLKNAFGKPWQCGTIQLDFQMPEKFDLTYEGDDNQKHRPVMLHRAILGSVERFMGILIEKFEGKFPLWISPTQITILTIADRHNEYAKELETIFRKEGFRVELSLDAETMNKKIRNAQVSKINYILVVGDKEQENKTINVRTRENQVLGEKKVTDFIKELQEEIRTKKI
ncbi:MAG: threonine--tRNA ligase [archaeon]